MCRAVHPQVYNITPYLKFHPGGMDVLMKAAGRDGTALFLKFHPWVNAEALIGKCLVGFLDSPLQAPVVSEGHEDHEDQP